MLITNQEGTVMKSRVFSEETLMRVRIKKALWDARELHKKARFILIISPESGIKLLENNDYAANVFAVLAPSDLEGERVDETLILEIGIGKGTPYAHTFKKNSRGQNIANRRKFREATESEKKIIWEQFQAVMIRLTKERRDGWKKNEPRYKELQNGEIIAFNRGQHFLVSTKDKWLLEGILDLEWKYRWKQYLYKYSLWIRVWLKKYKYSHYPEKQARGFVNLRKVMGLLKGIRFRHPYITWRFIESIGKKQGSDLIQSMAGTFEINLDGLSYEIPRISLWLPEYHIFIDRVNGKRNILVFECAPNKIELDEYARKKLGLDDRNEEDPDDIPFAPEELEAHHRGRPTLPGIGNDDPPF